MYAMVLNGELMSQNNYLTWSEMDSRFIRYVVMNAMSLKITISRGVRWINKIRKEYAQIKEVSK